jgi:hypothetical protein
MTLLFFGCGIKGKPLPPITTTTQQQVQSATPTSSDATQVAAPKKPEKIKKK